jgi:hypothetical protein
MFFNNENFVLIFVICIFILFFYYKINETFSEEEKNQTVKLVEPQVLCVANCINQKKLPKDCDCSLNIKHFCNFFEAHKNTHNGFKIMSNICYLGNQPEIIQSPTITQQIMKNIQQPPLGQSIINQPPLGQSIINQPPLGQSTITQPPSGQSTITQPPLGQSLQGQSF